MDIVLKIRAAGMRLNIAIRSLARHELAHFTDVAVSLVALLDIVFIKCQFMSQSTIFFFNLV